jgi:carbamoyl-phosphate synthase small subunit
MPHHATHTACSRRPITMKLVLADGTVFSGRSFGALREARGEVVFNTGMVGYVETLTDPSYRGQILVATYPLQGNYGVPRGPFESARIQVQSLIVHHHSHQPSHHTSLRTLGGWLKSQNIPAMEGVDTRSLTRHLRRHGTIEGQLLLDESEKKDSLGGDLLTSPEVIEMADVIGVVAPKEVRHYPGGELRILLVDTGAKENIVRCLQTLGATVIRVPWNYPWETYLEKVDGLMLTNGPGDPDQLSELIHLRRVRHAFHSGIPILAICLGHQWLALAAGGKVYKLKYGHRSHNQPVLDLTTRRAYLTSQNHGYAVDVAGLEDEWEPWFINLNDGSNEGIRHKTKPFRSVQFHPEAAAGPRDTRFLFEDFLRAAGEFRSTNSSHLERV